MADAASGWTIGAAALSVGNALWLLWRERRLERDKAINAAELKRLEAQLGAEGRLQDARTRYEWEARKRLSEEVVQYMQHLYTDELEAIVDTLLLFDDKGQVSLKRYGEFRAEVLDPDHETARRMAPALLLFRGMSPWTRPVLWRALIACAVLAKLTMDVLAERGGGTGRSLGGRLAEVPRAEWLVGLTFGDTAALEAEVRAVVAALRERLDGNRVGHIRLA